MFVFVFVYLGAYPYEAGGDLFCGFTLDKRAEIEDGTGFLECHSHRITDGLSSFFPKSQKTG
jgi:hypothetical protein